MVAAAGALAALLGGARIAGGLLILLAAALDAAGVAARRGGGLSAVLDGVADRYADTLILAGMAAWSYRHEHHPVPLVIGFAALAGTLGLAYTAARVQASAGRPAARALLAWTGRDVRLLILVAGALIGQAYWALVVVAVLANAPVVWTLARLPDLLGEQSPSGADR
jgi:phosphatidylglycerophosphate synthase